MAVVETGLTRGAAVIAAADMIVVPPPTALPLFLLLPCELMIERGPKLPRTGHGEQLIDLCAADLWLRYLSDARSESQ